MRKVIIVFMVMFFLASVYAFERGTINVGGDLSYSSTKASSESDASTIFLFSTQIGYFFIDNLTFDFGFDLITLGDGYDSLTQFGFGIGSRYIFDDMIYLGSKFMNNITITNDNTNSGLYLKLVVGYLAPLVKNVVYLDVGASYTMGIGDYGGHESGNNEESSFNVGAGLEFFITK